MIDGRWVSGGVCEGLVTGTVPVVDISPLPPSLLPSLRCRCRCYCAVSKGYRNGGEGGLLYPVIAYFCGGESGEDALVIRSSLWRWWVFRG